MSCNQCNHLSDGPPTGLRAFYEENKVPIGISLVAIGSVTMYAVLKKKPSKKRNKTMSDLSGRKRKGRKRNLNDLSDNVFVINKRYASGHEMNDKYYFSNSQLRMYDKAPNTDYYISVDASDKRHALELLKLASPISKVGDLSDRKRKGKLYKVDFFSADSMNNIYLEMTFVFPKLNFQKDAILKVSTKDKKFFNHLKITESIAESTSKYDKKTLRLLEKTYKKEIEKKYLSERNYWSKPLSERLRK